MGVNGIYGLSGSGIDIESMVKVGMMGKQKEYDKMAQKFTKNEWTKTALLDINSQLTTFNMSKLSDYKMSSSMNSRTADSSNDNVVKATANATSALMSHKVSVDTLSSNAYLISKKNAVSKIVESNGGDTGSIKLQDILFKGLTNNETRTDVTDTYTGEKTKTATKTTFGSGNPTIKTTQSASGSKTSVAKDSSGNALLTVNTSTDGKTTTYTANGTTITFTKNNDGSTTVTDGVSSNNYSWPQNPSYSSSGLTITQNTGWSGDGTTDIVLNGSTTFKTNSDNEITSITTGGNNYSTSSSTATTTTTYETTFNDEKKITLTKTTSNGNTTATYSDGTNTYTDGTVSVSATEETFTFGTKDTNYYGKVTLDARSPNSSLIKVETQKVGITGSTTGGTELGTFYNGVALTDTAIAFKIGDGTNETETISYTYEEILGGKTINDLISDINSKANKANVNIRASYDLNNDIFSLYNSKGGKENQILITALDGIDNSSGVNTLAGTAAKDFFNALGLKQSTGGQLVAPSSISTNSNLTGDDDSEYLTLSELGTAEGVGGTNGKVTVDGVEYDNITDNKITVGGVTYNLLNTTETGTTATVTVGQDIDAIVDKVKSFVEDYNKILSGLYEKYDEKGDSGYKPLTQAQKDAMKDEQIEKWEEKAKKGLLYHDSTVGKIISQMREAISTSVEGVSGKYNSAYSIGISTTGIKGQLVLDETKLRKALSEDSDSVYNVFAKLGDVKDKKGNEDTKYNGIAQRLGDILTNANKTIKTRAGSSSDITEDSDLNNLLRELQTKMSNFKKLMKTFEDRLYKKYDAMETALAKLGTQLNFITGAQG